MQVRKRKSVVMAAFCVLSALYMIGLGGCGGGSLVSNAGGVEAVGTLASNRARTTKAITRTGNSLLNPNYGVAYQAPTTFVVAMTKLEILKGTNDTTPYVVFDTADVNNPRTITFTGDTTSGALGANASYPDAGTYTHCRMTLVYEQMTINADLGAGMSATTFRVYFSTVSPVQHGDVLMNLGGTWNWMYGQDFVPITGTRVTAIGNEQIIQQTTLAQAGSPDPYVFTAALASPMVVPSRPSGTYRISANFDVTASPDVSGSTGIFMWNDCTADGLFKPGVPMSSGGDDNFDESDTKGHWEWMPLTPTITFSYTEL